MIGTDDRLRWRTMGSRFLGRFYWLLVAILASSMAASSAQRAAAQTCSTTSFPYALTNGSTADASQVTADLGCAPIYGLANWGGNVGIGTQSPVATLEVYASTTGVASSSSTLLISSGGGAGTMASLNFAPWKGRPGGASAALIGQDDGDASSNLLFQTAPTGSANTSLITRMIVTSSGNVGIGTTSPSDLLYVNGTVYATGAAGNLSDARHKTAVKTLEADALSVVEKIRPVTFFWKEPKDDGMKGEQVGFIAQEIEEILPTVVTTQNDKDKTKGIKYTEIIPVLVKAIQQQQQLIKSQQDAIAELRDEIKGLKYNTATSPSQPGQQNHN